MKSVGWGSGLGLCQARGLLVRVMKPGPLLWHAQPQLPVCLPTLSQWTHDQLDSSAIFAAINAIRLERKSITGVHLSSECRRGSFGAEPHRHSRFHKMFWEVSLRCWGGGGGGGLHICLCVNMFFKLKDNTPPRRLCFHLHLFVC